MPELPEVEITRQKLAPLLRGRRILEFWTDWPRGLRAAHGKGKIAKDMRGRTIVGIERRGKVLFFMLSGKPPRVMAVHLRMSGRLAAVRGENPNGYNPSRSYRPVSSRAVMRWTHFRWRLADGLGLHFVDPRKFGVVWYGSPAALSRDRYLGRLGVDAAAISRQDFIARFRSRRGMIKPALLRQDIVAGIGNVIADESLWRARLHPATPASALGTGDIASLHRAIRTTIRTILASGGTSLRTFRHPDGRIGRYQERRLAYGNAGKPCPRCRTPLMRVVLASRGTTICPKCQRRSLQFQT